MGRPLGARNRRTIIREAEETIDRVKATNEVPLDSLHVIEQAMRHFYLRAEMGKHAGDKSAAVDADYKEAAALAAMVAPYRHARLSAVKLANVPNNPSTMMEGASADQIRARICEQILVLSDAGVLDLEELLASKRKTVN